MRFSDRYYNYTLLHHNLFNTSTVASTNNYQLINSAKNAIKYNYIFVTKLLLPYPSFSSITGFVLFTAILVQIASGFYLACYYLPEPGLIVELREEMFIETRYGLEVYTMHVRGVDVLFTCSYIHIFKKIYLRNFTGSESDGWLLGGYAFIFFHYIVGLGICLSASHLSDLTFTIAANLYWSLVLNTHKTYYIIFTNKHLNVDQLIRLMILHYISPLYYLTLVQLHIFYCHESWDSHSGTSVYEGKRSAYITWFYDAFKKEFGDSNFNIIMITLFFWNHTFYVYPNNYFFFEHWNTYEIEEINFFYVAPHWYFRPLMGLLVVSPTHYEGVMWLVGFFLLLSFMPILNKFYKNNEIANHEPYMNMYILHLIFYFIFMFTLLTTASVLPCGRYYYDPESGYVGNVFIKLSYQYVYLYLGWLVYNLEFIDIIFIKLLHIKYQLYGETWSKKKPIHIKFIWNKSAYPQIIKVLPIRQKILYLIKNNKYSYKFIKKNMLNIKFIKKIINIKSNIPTWFYKINLKFIKLYK